MNAINNLPQVEPWDVTKSFIVEWPSDGKEVSLALAVEEQYDRENEESSSQ